MSAKNVQASKDDRWELRSNKPWTNVKVNNTLSESLRVNHLTTVKLNDVRFDPSDLRRPAPRSEALVSLMLHEDDGDDPYSRLRV